MKKLIYIIAILIGATTIAKAQQGPGTIKAWVDKDGVPIFRVSDVKIYGEPSSKKAMRRLKRRMKKFNKLRYNVIKVYPYAKECGKNLEVINGELSQIQDEATQKTYMKAKESYLFGKYEKDIRNLSITQGHVLVKLIDRETGDHAYSLIKDYKSSAAAFFWQGVGRLFGYNLKENYDPEEEFAIEVIIQSIENGTNPTYYDYLEARNSAGGRF